MDMITDKIIIKVAGKVWGQLEESYPLIRKESPG